MKHRKTPYPRYTQNFRDRHGRLRSYFRHGGVSVPLPEPHFSEAYWAAYRQCLAGEQPQPRPAIGAARTKAGSVAAGFALFVQSGAFKSLAQSTQRKYFRTLRAWVDRCPDHRLADLRTRHLVPWFDEKAEHPGAGRDLFKAMRAMFGYLVSVGQLETDPTQGLKPPRQRNQPIHTWTEPQIEQFRQHHPVGSMARLSLELLIGTGQRRSDVVRMGWQHLRDGRLLFVEQAKTGWRGHIPIGDELAGVLDALPRDRLTFIVNERGRAYTPTSFGMRFRAWCDAAALPQECSAHGLRKAVCRRLAEASCSENEIAAISGHSDWRLVKHYTKAADQVRLAKAAMAKSGTKIVKPLNPVLQNGTLSR
jgi:integrase